MVEMIGRALAIRSIEMLGMQFDAPSERRARQPAMAVTLGSDPLQRLLCGRFRA